MGRDAHRELALVDRQLARKREQLVAQSLRARVLVARRQRPPLEHREHVEAQRVDPEPRRVCSEACPWQHARTELVLHHAVHPLDGPGLLPVPAHQVRRVQLVPVAHDGVVTWTLRLEQFALTRGEPQRHVAQRGGVARPVPRRELHLGEIDLLTLARLERNPSLARHRGAALAQLLGHVGADREADLLGDEVLEQQGVVARRVGAQATLNDPRWQIRKRPLDRAQRILAAGDVAIARIQASRFDWKASAVSLLRLYDDAVASPKLTT